MSNRKVLRLVRRILNMRLVGLPYAVIDAELGWDYRSYQMMRTTLARRIAALYS